MRVNNLLYLNNRRIVKMVSILLLFLNQILLIIFILLQDKRYQDLHNVVIEEIKFSYQRELTKLRQEYEYRHNVNDAERKAEDNNLYTGP